MSPIGFLTIKCTLGGHVYIVSLRCNIRRVIWETLESGTYMGKWYALYPYKFALYYFRFRYTYNMYIYTL